jgi:hypothetical protein
MKLEEKLKKGGKSNPDDVSIQVILDLIKK